MNTTNHRKPKPTFSLNKDQHAPPRSPFWFASFRDEHGRRVRRSTAMTDETKAKEIATAWAKLAAEGRQNRLSESRCREVISQMHASLIGEPLHFRTCRAYLEEWLEGVKTSVDEGTWRCYRTSITGFLEHLGTKAEQQLQDITPTDILQWRNKLRAKGLSAPTVNGHLKVLRIPFNRAHDLGYIPINVCGTKAVPPIRDDAEDVEKDVFTPKQIGELIEAAPSEDWRGLILCGYFTGLRLRDCSELQWGNVDMGEQIIKVKPHKTRRHGTTVTIPIHPRFMLWLRKQTRGIARAPVFPTLSGMDSGGKSGLSAGFTRIMDKAKIKGRLIRERNGVGRSRSSLSFHSLRHSFNSGLANQGVDAELRQALCGHSSPDQNETYTHREIEVMRQAIKKLPSEFPCRKARMR
jgi:integrase